MAEWIDDEFERLKEQARCDKVLEANGQAFLDKLAGILEEDADEMKRKLHVAVIAEQPTEGWIKLEKTSPLPDCVLPTDVPLSTVKRVLLYPVEATTL